MAKGYWIGRVDVKNEEGYKPYAAANAAIFKKFGGRFVVRAGSLSARRAPPARAMSSSSFPTTPAHLPAIARRNIRRTSRSACRTRQPISLLLRATTARSRSAFRNLARYTDASSGE